MRTDLSTGWVMNSVDRFTLYGRVDLYQPIGLLAGSRKHLGFKFRLHRAWGSRGPEELPGHAGRKTIETP